MVGVGSDGGAATRIKTDRENPPCVIVTPHDPGLSDRGEQRRAGGRADRLTIDQQQRQAVARHLVAAVMYCAVTHGPFAAVGGGSVQPATT